MKYTIFLLVLSSCSVFMDPKIYEDSAELIEEVIKDEAHAQRKKKEKLYWCEESDQMPSSSPIKIITKPFRCENG